MKKSMSYLILTVIWALGSWAWIANVMRHAQTGTLNWLHIVTAVCSVICAVLNLLLYFRKREEEK